MEKWGGLVFEGHHRVSRVPGTPDLPIVSGIKIPQATSLTSELAKFPRLPCYHEHRPARPGT